MIDKLKMCTTGKILVEMSVPQTETSRLAMSEQEYIYIYTLYIYIYILYIMIFKFDVKHYLKNLGV